MPWVRFDDQFTIHRKVDGLSDAAFRLHTSAIFWCARNLTDGFVSEEDLDGVTARVRTPARFAAECVKRGIWHDARKPCDSDRCPGPVDGDGWVIHDYLEYQFSKEQVIHNREQNKERQKRHRDSRNGDRNGVTNARSKSPPTRPDPITTPQPPDADASGGQPAEPEHHGQHKHCRACGTSPRGPKPPPQPTAAERHPSARPITEVTGVNGHPADPGAVAAIAAQARAAITRDSP